MRFKQFRSNHILLRLNEAEQKWGTFEAVIHHQDLHDVALIASRKH
jgi:hypothetical protein